MELIKQNFDASKHAFFIHSAGSEDHINTQIAHTKVGSLLNIRNALHLASAMTQADKIILHGLFSNTQIVILNMVPHVLARCHWVMWGGDLYRFEPSGNKIFWLIKEWLRRRVISRIGYLITYIEGDYQLARRHYAARGKYEHSIMYPSNVCNAYTTNLSSSEGYKLLLGNSADSSNEHIDAIRTLEPFANENITIYCPLSYGSSDQGYIEEICELGCKIFGGKFRPLLEFMQLEDYEHLLDDIDIAVFAHHRQQGMGNIINLLGRGKMVYMRKHLTSLVQMQKLGLIMGDLDSFKLEILTQKQQSSNQQIVRDHFSESKLINQWSAILE